MDIKTTLIIVHIIGTVLGVGGATFAEIFFLKDIKDGHIEPLEADYLKTTYKVLRIGMILLVLSGFGFLLFYRLTGRTELLYSEKLWAKLTIVGLILINAILFELRKIPAWLGSAVSLTSWYAALILGIVRGGSLSYAKIMYTYIIAVLIVAVILEVVKKSMHVKL